MPLTGVGSPATRPVRAVVLPMRLPARLARVAVSRVPAAPRIRVVRRAAARPLGSDLFLAPLFLAPLFAAPLVLAPFVLQPRVIRRPSTIVVPLSVAVPLLAVRIGVRVRMAAGWWLAMGLSRTGIVCFGHTASLGDSVLRGSTETLWASPPCGEFT